MSSSSETPKPRAPPVPITPLRGVVRVGVPSDGPVSPRGRGRGRGAPLSPGVSVGGAGGGGGGGGDDVLEDDGYKSKSSGVGEQDELVAPTMEAPKSPRSPTVERVSPRPAERAPIQVVLRKSRAPRGEEQQQPDKATTPTTDVDGKKGLSWGRTAGRVVATEDGAVADDQGRRLPSQWGRATRTPSTGEDTSPSRRTDDPPRISPRNSGRITDDNSSSGSSGGGSGTNSTKDTTRTSPRSPRGARLSDRIPPSSEELPAKPLGGSHPSIPSIVNVTRPRRDSGWMEDADEEGAPSRPSAPPLNISPRQRTVPVDLDSLRAVPSSAGAGTSVIQTRGRSVPVLELGPSPVLGSVPSAAGTVLGGASGVASSAPAAPAGWATRQRNRAGGLGGGGGGGHGGDVLGVNPEEYKPLVGLKNKTRRNSLAGLPGFSGDPTLRMAQLIGEFPFFMEQVSHLIDSSDSQRLVDAIINVTVPFGQTLNVAKGLILGEFEANKSQPSSILRGNCVASKLMGSFGHFVGHKYLLGILHEHVTKICEMRERLRFELDPTKEERSDVRASNRKNLVDFTTGLMKKIMDPTNVIPPEICAMAKFTADAAKTFCPEQYSQLVGGYIMLRLINPSLVAPEAYKIIDPSQVPSPHARRNLTLVSKVLQNISNGVKGGATKELFMGELSDFVSEQSLLFFAFLERVAGAGEDLTTRKPIPADEADVGFMEGKHLAFLVRTLSTHGDALSKALSALPRKTVRELELLQRVHEVQQEQEPPKNKNPSVLPWMSKHFRSGALMKTGDKKRKKKKKVMRLELTRCFLYVVDPSLPTVQSSSQIRKVYPVDSLEVVLKQEKKESFLEISVASKTMVFVNHEDCDKVEEWHRAILHLKSDASRLKPQAGNERFLERPSRGAVSDVLTAMQGMPRLAYQVHVQQRFSGKPGSRGPSDVKAVVKVMAFGCKWEVELSFFQISAILSAIQSAGGDGLIVTPTPHIFAHLFSSKPGAEPVDPALMLGFDESGRPSMGCVVLREWLTAFFMELQSNFDYSHCKMVMDVLELSSPFRAASSGSIAHLRWIHRYKLGLGVRDRRGVNVLMHLVSVKEDAEYVGEMIRFLIDSRAVSLKDVDTDGNSVLHRCIDARVVERAVLLCELGVDHVPNKTGMMPLHVAVQLGDEWMEFVEACADQADATGDYNIILGLDESGRSPLHCAIMGGHARVAERIVDALEALDTLPRPVSQFGDLPKKPGTTCFHLAVAAGMKGLASRLISTGLMQQPSDATYFALASGVPDVIEALAPGTVDWNYVDPESKRTLMHAACSSGKPEAIKLCLDHKLETIQTDARGVTPVMCACESGSVAAVTSVLRYASNVADALNVPDSFGMTALHYGAMSRNLAVVKLLIQSGALYGKAIDKDKRTPLYALVESAASGSKGDNDETLAVVKYFLSLESKTCNVVPSSGTPALHFAVLKQDGGLVNALLESPATDVNLVDFKGSTALLIATQVGNASICASLMSRRANPNQSNVQGENPLSACLKQKRPDIAALFKD